ncbi:unnamed protein product [Effrenium voratum]|nr:unnamed protein product [Effrenium voratum]|mmetsp:Transcript_78996/g.189702  ORF Transcript_78996/g.189702 Transcript_78996/m.189702 type:complete len:221 (+) Transcript_78996:69-731(+)
MAPAEISTITETENGAAFEVQIKSPGADKLKTAARLRLESYDEKPKPLPMLLGARHPPISVVRGDKARQQNEHKKEVVERAREELQSTADAKRQGLEQQLEKATEIREGALESRKKRAAKHYEKVMEKKGSTEQRGLMTAAEAQKRLEMLLAQKEELRGASLAQRTAKANKHNEQVADKVHQHQEAMEEMRKKLAALPASERLMQLSLRLYEKHLVACLD